MVFPLLASSIAQDKWGCDLERAMNAAADEEEAVLKLQRARANMLERAMNAAADYEEAVLKVQRARANMLTVVPGIPGNATPTIAQGIDYVLSCFEDMGAIPDQLKVEAARLCSLGRYYEQWVLDRSWLPPFQYIEYI